MLVGLTLVVLGAGDHVVRAFGRPNTAVGATQATAGLVLVGGSMTAFMSDHRRLRHRAATDPLTGLANRDEGRRRAAELLERSLRAERHACVLIIDLDGFKQINDSAGHAAGDRVLAHVATSLTDTVRGDDVVARWGGDEFLVVLGNVRGDANLTERLDAIRRSIETVAVDDLDTVAVGASIGTAWAPRDASDFDELVGHADAAMYVDKRR